AAERLDDDPGHGNQVGRALPRLGGIEDREPEMVEEREEDGEEQAQGGHDQPGCPETPSPRGHGCLDRFPRPARPTGISYTSISGMRAVGPRPGTNRCWRVTKRGARMRARVRTASRAGTEADRSAVVAPMNSRFRHNMVQLIPILRIVAPRRS